MRTHACNVNERTETADDNEEQRQPMFTFHGWKYGHYFDFDLVKNEKNITVRCKLCVGRKILSTNLGEVNLFPPLLTASCLQGQRDWHFILYFYVG